MRDAAAFFKNGKSLMNKWIRETYEQIIPAEKFPVIEENNRGRHGSASRVRCALPTHLLTGILWQNAKPPEGIFP
jgi:hypothetical protein